jgi:hypothetical protein
VLLAMIVTRYTWSPSGEWNVPLPTSANANAQLILSFGPVDAPPTAWFDAVRAAWPAAQHVYCSGGGQILDGTVDDEITVVTAIQFDRATVHAVERHGANIASSASLGSDIGRALADVADLQHVLIFAEGLTFNGDAFVTALNAALPRSARVSGGLASNGLALSKSVVGLNGPPETGTVVAVGLAGDSLSINTGSVGGWDLFGPERIVTKSDTAVVYELDSENALAVYRRYLGTFADELPGIALLFPLAVWAYPGAPMAVRTILAIEEETGALRFAGDIPQGSTVRLMRTTTDKLIDGAASAAKFATESADNTAPSLTLCVSCIGRRAVMRTRVEEELEEVMLSAAGSPVVGFYSNGEIAPPTDGRDFAQAVLHNQTMTVTTIGER